MIEAVRFLERIGEYLDPAADAAGSRADLLNEARACLEALRLADPSADFMLGQTGVTWGNRPLVLEDAPWLDRLREEGVAILAPPNNEDGFGRWIARLAEQVADGPAVVEPVLVTVGAEVDSPAVPAPAPADAEPEPVATPPPSPAASLQPEADLVWLLHADAFHGRGVSFETATAVVAKLAAALEQTELTAESQIVCPLDEYTTVHCINTALLSMKLARHLAYDEGNVLAVGLAGLLHDIGKSRLGDLPSVSRDMLAPDEREVLKTHCAEGARLLLDCGAAFQAAAIVAYEHHMHWRGGGGYPSRHFQRSTHAYSRLVSVCDVYDVLRSERTFRPALSAEAAIKYLRLLGGQGLDPDVVTAFVDLAREPLARIDLPTRQSPAEANEIGWLPESGYDADCEPRPVRL